MLRQDADLRLKPDPREPASVSPPAPRPRRALLLAATLALAVAAAVAAVLLLRDGGGEPGAARPASSPQLRSFVNTVENFLAQSHEGRVDVMRVLAGAFDCSLSPQVAAAQLDGVQENRQSLLEQLAALNVPEEEAAVQSADLLQKASHASIAADWIYRDWLRGRTTCVRGSKAPAAARRTDARATALKRRFLVAFDPLAKRFGKRVWRADEF
jgi:hypothetical protein